MWAGEAALTAVATWVAVMEVGWKVATVQRAMGAEVATGACAAERRGEGEARRAVEGARTEVV